MIDTVGTFIYFRFSIFFEYITGKRDNDFDTVRGKRKGGVNRERNSSVVLCLKDPRCGGSGQGVPSLQGLGLEAIEKTCDASSRS